MDMRKLLHHIVGGDKAPQLEVQALDAPGSGNACHRYGIFGFNTESNPSGDGKANTYCEILFQNGPLKDASGANGITHEALLAILIDRLSGFQSGPYKSQYNEDALNALRLALSHLQARTHERIRRGVEGMHKI
jgi:hypothetical protein